MDLHEFAAVETGLEEYAEKAAEKTTVPQPPYRVTYTRHGDPGWCDFHCLADAMAFAEWGSESGVFIHPELTKKMED